MDSRGLLLVLFYLISSTTANSDSYDSYHSMHGAKTLNSPEENLLSYDESKEDLYSAENLTDPPKNPYYPASEDTTYPWCINPYACDENYCGESSCPGYSFCCRSLAGICCLQATETQTQRSQRETPPTMPAVVHSPAFMTEKPSIQLEKLPKPPQIPGFPDVPPLPSYPNVVPHLPHAPVTTDQSAQYPRFPQSRFQPPGRVVSNPQTSPIQPPPRMSPPSGYGPFVQSQFQPVHPAGHQQNSLIPFSYPFTCPCINQAKPVVTININNYPMSPVFYPLPKPTASKELMINVPKSSGHQTYGHMPFNGQNYLPPTQLMPYYRKPTEDVPYFYGRK